MTKKIPFLIFFILAMNFTQAQKESVLLKGTITANTTDLDGVSIINIQTDKSTATEKGGYFEINASLGDTLVFSGIQFEKKKMVISKEAIKTEELIVKLQLKVRQIEEVVVENKINAVSLGIVPKNQKKYTVAERRLYAATGSTNEYGTNAKISLEGILNAISGRTTMLKKSLIIEKNELIIQKTSNWFDENYFVETLKIPKEYIAGFKYYLADNEKYKEAVNNKNKALATFFMSEIATEYLSLLNEK